VAVAVMFWSNGEQLERIAISKAFQQGLSFVETMRIKEGKLCYLRQHLTRLYNAFADFALEPAWELDRLELVLLSLDLFSSGFNGRGRLQSYDDHGVQYVVFTVDDFMYKSALTLGSGFTLGLATSVRSSSDPRYRYKTNQYLSAVIEQRKQPGYDELLYLNEQGFLTEGTKSNVFFVKDHSIFTPERSCNLLEGIMRQEVTEILRAEGFDFQSGCYTIEDIKGAESIFLTNALLPVAWVKIFMNQSFSPLSPSLMKAFSNL